MELNLGSEEVEHLRRREPLGNGEEFGVQASMISTLSTSGIAVEYPKRRHTAVGLVGKEQREAGFSFTRGAPPGLRATLSITRSPDLVQEGCAPVADTKAQGALDAFSVDADLWFAVR